MLRWFATAGLLLLLGLNTLSGVAKIAFFFHSYQAEDALARADMDTAMEHLEASFLWQAGNASNHALVGRVTYLAAANGLPLKGIARGDQEAMLGRGVGAVARGLTLNPADSWIWFTLVEVYRGHQQGRERRQRMRAAGSRAAAGTETTSVKTMFMAT